MDRLYAMQVFTKVVDLNSFSLAAEALCLPSATVSTLIEALESHLTVRLLNGVAGQIGLTPDGASYYVRCVAILADVEDAERSLITTGKLLSGKRHFGTAG
jgi:LysR family transcriptional regulator, regulator for bpeEF and oprC